jgi:hypothetical protein
MRLTSAAMPISSGVSALAAELAPRVSMQFLAHRSVGSKRYPASAAPVLTMKVSTIATELVRWAGADVSAPLRVSQ